MSKPTQAQELTNEQRKIIGLHCVELMQLEAYKKHEENAVDEIAKEIVKFPDDPGILIRKRYPDFDNYDYDDISHFLKCCVAAGIVGSEDLPEITRWPFLKENPCYKLPLCWYEAAYDKNSQMNHEHLTDYVGRTRPEYLTKEALAVYCSVDKHLSNTQASLDTRHRLIATLLLVSSRKKLEINEAVRVIQKYGQKAISAYAPIEPRSDKEKQVAQRKRQVLAFTLLQASKNEVKVEVAMQMAKDAMKDIDESSLFLKKMK